LPKIHYRNKGGIGNQLFIYFFAKSVSINYSIPLFVDSTTGFKRDYYKRTPCINNVINDNLPESSLFIKLIYRIKKYIPEFLFNIVGYKNIIEKSNREYVNTGLKNLNKFHSILIDGYFQSYKYFDDYKEVIIANAFKNFKIYDTYFNYYNLIKDSNSISIHVRRKQYNNLLSIDYYIEAIEYMKNQLSNTNYFLFTDDIAWCKENFIIESLTIVEVYEPNEIQELYLMSMCNHNIIANSSFSWWGAYLSKNTNKVIIAPGKTDIGVLDMFFPENWIII
jgi:hypothetical protein